MPAATEAVVDLRVKRPSPWQREFDQRIRDPIARVIVCVLGRKAGKTTAVERIIVFALERRVRVGWYAHVDKAARIAWDFARAVLPPALVVSRNEAEHTFTLANGSTFTFGSMKEPDNNRGGNFDLVVCDEGAQISAYARDMVVGPLVAEGKPGVIVVFTTPKGKRGRGGWVYRDFMKAKGGSPGYFQIKGRTEDNPLRSVKAWAAWARKNLPEATVKQEIDADFLEGGGGVVDFRRISINGGDEEHPVTLPFHEDPVVGANGTTRREACVVGLDPAQTRDYFGCAAIEVESHRLRGMIRFHGYDWPRQVQMAAEFWKRYAGPPGHRIPARLDTTGIGSPVGTLLQQHGVRFVGVNFSKKPEHRDERFDVDNKTLIVQALQVATEQDLWSAPWIEELITEGDAFEMELLSSGHVRYAAAEGFKDDLVIAVGLAICGMPSAAETLVYGLAPAAPGPESIHADEAERERAEDEPRGGIGGEW
jgi:Terminase large subunit, T4likevirus-type, N-terminal